MLTICSAARAFTSLPAAAFIDRSRSGSPSMASTLKPSVDLDVGATAAPFSSRNNHRQPFSEALGHRQPPGFPISRSASVIHSSISSVKLHPRFTSLFHFDTIKVSATFAGR